MVRNKLRWDANNAVGLPKQKNSYQSSPTFLCFESPTALFASQHNLFRTMWPDPAKGLIGIHFFFYTYAMLQWQHTSWCTWSSNTGTILAGEISKNSAHVATLKIDVFLSMLHGGTSSNELNSMHHVAETKFCPRNRTVLGTCFMWQCPLQVLT